MTTITLSMRLDFKLLFVHLEMSLMDSTDSRQNDTKIALCIKSKGNLFGFLEAGPLPPLSG